METNTWHQTFSKHYERSTTNNHLLNTTNMFYPSIFDNFFAPTRIVVVSEEKIRQAEIQAKEEQIDRVDQQIDALVKYQKELKDRLKALQGSSKSEEDVSTQEEKKDPSRLVDKHLSLDTDVELWD